MGRDQIEENQPPVRRVASKVARNPSGCEQGVWAMPRRILIADDSALTRKTLQEMLETHGWEVCGQAENGRDAVSMAVALNPDVVILDLAMPLMNGLTAAREISESLPTIPMVMHTLHVFPQLEAEAKKNGVCCVVPKSESARIISILDELTSPRVSACPPQAAAVKQSPTTRRGHVPFTEGTAPEIEAEPASQSDALDDNAKAS